MLKWQTHSLLNDAWNIYQMKLYEAVAFLQKHLLEWLFVLLALNTLITDTLNRVFTRDWMVHWAVLVNQKYPWAEKIPLYKRFLKEQLFWYLKWFGLVHSLNLVHFKELCQRLSLSAKWVHISPHFSWTIWCHYLILWCLGLLGFYDVHSLKISFFD